MILIPAGQGDGERHNTKRRNEKNAHLLGKGGRKEVWCKEGNQKSG